MREREKVVLVLGGDPGQVFRNTCRNPPDCMLSLPLLHSFSSV